jgi:1-hydroxycarotenoid 3,4-desaturase
VRDRVVVIGAGVGGLVGALALASRGVAVTVVERAEGPGGKMREVGVGRARLDSGRPCSRCEACSRRSSPEAGASLDAHLTLQPADLLARHAWSVDERLDLFADRERSADAIGALAGPDEARGFKRFCDRARRTFEVLDRPFMRASQPSVGGLTVGVGLRGLGDLWLANPFGTLWDALGTFFEDPRLRQLFGRYATYCGSSPFRAPATLMLVAHVEAEGVWLVEGGMHRLAQALAGLARERGATVRYGVEATSIDVAGGRVSAVRLSDGERLPADAVVVNGDAAAVAAGLFGPSAAGDRPPARLPNGPLSAVTSEHGRSKRTYPLSLRQPTSSSRGTTRRVRGRFSSARGCPA